MKMQIEDPAFPILNLPDLLSLPKGRKPHDMERILHSPISEDWVTWNFFQLLFWHHPNDWWGHLIRVAGRRNPDFKSNVEDSSLPTPRFWSSVLSPSEYEAQSRDRMRASGRAKWESRAEVAEPVEGPSEVDIRFDHAQFLVFIEAKLTSDVSARTTYDPQRNQIIRNIDCLIAGAGNRLLWSDFKELICGPSGNPETIAVKRELERRILA